MTQPLPTWGSPIALLFAVTLSGCWFQSDHKPVEKMVAPTPHIIEHHRSDPWVLIDSEGDRLTVYRNGGAPIEFRNVAFGAAGVKHKQRRGDDVTPRGTYTVGWVRRQSKFSIFIGLNYPSLEDAQRGYQRGIINLATFEEIKGAHQTGRVPPQDTALGGHIGIHGVGRGSLEIHRIANWTAGCIAVENQQIELLSEIVKPGTQVEIR